MPQDPSILDEAIRVRNGKLESVRIEHYDHQCDTVFEFNERNEIVRSNNETGYRVVIRELDSDSWTQPR